MKNLIIIVALIGLVSCGKKTEYIEKPGLNTLTELNRGEFEECSGILVQSGVDANQNGVLDLEEIQNEQLVCNEKIVETIQIETPVYIEVPIEVNKCKKDKKDHANNGNHWGHSKKQKKD